MPTGKNMRHVRDETQIVLPISVQQIHAGSDDKSFDGSKNCHRFERPNMRVFPGAAGGLQRGAQSVMGHLCIKL